MSKRAWWLVALNLLIPGAPQVLAGSRRFGRFALGTTMLFWLLVVVGVLAVLIGGEAIIPIITMPAVLWGIAVVLGLYGVLWVICALDSFRLARLAKATPATRVGVSLLAIVALVIAGGAAFAGSYTAGVTAAHPGQGRLEHGRHHRPGWQTGDRRPDHRPGQHPAGRRRQRRRQRGVRSPGRDAQRRDDPHPPLARVEVGDRRQHPARPLRGSAGLRLRHPAVGQARFNTALSRGGLDCVVASASALTGLPIQYAAQVEFDGVVAMSDAVGGVPVCLVTAIDDPYSGLSLSAGEHTLQGGQALAFLRTRHGLSTGSDLQRISNQQIFLSSLMRTIKSSQTLDNPLKLIALAQAAATQHEAQHGARADLDHGVDGDHLAQHPTRPDRVRAVPVSPDDRPRTERDPSGHRGCRGPDNGARRRSGGGHPEARGRRGGQRIPEAELDAQPRRHRRRRMVERRCRCRRRSRARPPTRAPARPGRPG